MTKNQVELESLAGKEGVLSGVWFGQDLVKPYDWDDTIETVNTCYFMWEGQIYQAAEDPNDGYRSSLAFLRLRDDLFPVAVWSVGEHCRMTYMKEKLFPHDTWRSPEECGILQLTSVITGKVVLEIGTGNTNDYYPYCVMHFDPLNMGVNQPEVDLIGRGVTPRSNQP